MSEKLCLKWNDFQENVNTAFGNLREDTEFTDVTLACEDGQQIEAHKVILAASSPFFQNLLKRNKHPHPLIYMRGLKSEDLGAIVDFLYCGEANVLQDNLESFLAIAEELRLKGLMGQNKDTKLKAENNTIHTGPTDTPKEIKVKSYISSFPINEETHYQDITPERRMAIPNLVSGEFKELDEQVKSMMVRSQNTTPNGKEKAKICKMCGKEGYAMAIRDHIEANHLEGVSLPCDVCGKDFRSRMLLRKHKCLTKI